MPKGKEKQEFLGFIFNLWNIDITNYISFNVGGYYTADVNNKYTIIALNTDYFSNRAEEYVQAEIQLD